MIAGAAVRAEAGGRVVVSADPRRFDVPAEGNPTLVATGCDDCGTSVFGTHRACLACASPRIARTPVADRGVVLSYSIIHRPSKDWWGGTPYLVAETETDDGVVVVAGMVDVADGQIEVGLRVGLRVVLVEHPSQDARVAVYQWAPLAASESGDDRDAGR